MNAGNVIIGQSGGPTAVINSSLAGIFTAARERGAKTIYGMRNGIKGLLQNEYVDLSDYIKCELDVELVKRTPSSYLGSCRYKLPNVSEDESVYINLFDLLKKLEVKYFFYIGGNDSMDTIMKLSEYARYIKSDIIFMGVPKTVDNDLPVTDHTPGFGSAAKYISTTLKEVIKDGHVYDKSLVTIVETMGRNAGWLAASSSMTKTADCPGPDMIFMPELVFNVENFLTKVENMLKERKSIVIAVSEGLKLLDGTYVCHLEQNIRFHDAFGHAALSGTSRYLSEEVAIKLGCKTRSIEFSTMQRCASHLVSRTDVTEAFLAGGHAVRAAFNGENAKMIIFKRTSSDPYHITTETCDVHLIANIEKKIPLDWIINDGTFVSKEFFTYCRPLIQAELNPFMVDGIPYHLPPIDTK